METLAVVRAELDLAIARVSCTGVESIVAVHGNTTNEGFPMEVTMLYEAVFS